MAVQPVPEGYPRVTPYLSVDGAAEAIDYYTEVLGATERYRLPAPDGKLGHAELSVGDGLIMLADPAPDIGFDHPGSLGGSPVAIHVYVDDVDAVFEKALARGGTEVRAPENQFYGDRNGTFLDPWGHRWSIATHVEDVTPEEMAKRMSEMGS